jgi:uncharacterized glyoxalase superfamily protein PhnB
MIERAVPVLSVRDCSKAEDYYCRILGFERVFAHRPDPDKSNPGYLGVARDGVLLHLESFRTERAGQTSAFIVVSDVDRLFAEISEKGAICQMPPTDQTWGNRETHIRDQDGNGLCFGESLKGSTGGRAS